MHKYDSKKIVQTAVLCFVVSVLTGYMVFMRVNLMKYETSLSNRFEIVVFLSKDVAAPEVQGEKIRALKNVKDMSYFSREAVKEKLSNFAQEILIAGDNPFPDTFSVTLNNISFSNTQELVKELTAIPGVEEVKYDKSLLELIENIRLASKLTVITLKVVLSLFFIALMAGLMVDYFANKHNFYLNILHSYKILLGATVGSSAGVVFTVLFRKIFGLGSAFAAIPLKWYLMIFIAGIAAGFYQMSVQALKEKKK